jgi:2-O-methyltransferase
MLRIILRHLRSPRAEGEIPLDKIARYLPENPVVLEAGAHVGLDTVKLAQAWPAAQIHAFEPVPAIFKQLKATTSGFKNISCYQLAIGQKDGSAQIHVSGGESDGSSSLLKPKEHLSLHPEVSFSKPIKVEVSSIDSWAETHSIKKLDFLWLDLQGLELAALKGATNILDSVSVIHSEVNLVEVYEGVPLYKELRGWLEDHGFKVAFEAIDWDDGGNVLFVRS